MVSILTRPLRRVQPRRRGPDPGGGRCFNPHPPVEAGATVRFRGIMNRLNRVSILTRPLRRVQHRPVWGRWSR